ncbi:hypothetical protein Nwi_0142 [Nitrobacter winogradskyi Nb-255]|uniref:Uncharacterized protein n=1 Tax=Nitrobacter winogradskyi (strain ATCC 25391 / DSM 10237 / CIP 104748 / NCIMB 11846 / Nb-255) TaxID=323098 RepID=Q3SWD1_NITWN|nr:hypothetical protein Nwi_0142 [Nitrobacter winogradskyi Nb-255]
MRQRNARRGIGGIESRSETAGPTSSGPIHDLADSQPRVLTPLPGNGDRIYLLCFDAFSPREPDSIPLETLPSRQTGFRFLKVQPESAAWRQHWI